MRLEVSTTEIETGATGLAGYDLVVLSSSWDERCTRLIDESGLQFDRALLVKYANEGVTGRASKHRAFLGAWLRGVGAKVQTVELDSVAVLESWRSFRSAIVASFVEIGRPMRVLVDLSSIPRYLSLGLLGFGLRSGYVSAADYYYVEARRYETTNGSDGEFTSGRWLPWPVAGLGGPSPVRARSHLVVSAGFEGAKARKLVDALEPDRISIVVAYPGITPEFGGRALDESASLREAYLVPDSQFGTASLSVAEAFEVFTKLSDPREQKAMAFPEVTSFLLCGTKPHALAAAAASIQLECGDVLYVRPDDHRETSAAETGRVTLTRIAPPWVE